MAATSVPAPGAQFLRGLACDPPAVHGCRRPDAALRVQGPTARPARSAVAARHARRLAAALHPRLRAAVPAADRRRLHTRAPPGRLVAVYPWRGLLPQAGATVVTFVAAATGLVVVALEIGYLPTIYGAYNRRETLVNMLESRAGEPAWGVELLAREQLIGSLDSLGPFFNDWERWAAVYRIELPADPRPDAPIALTYEEFEDGLDRLQAVGFPMERSREEAWRHFRGWRVNYETAAYLLADKLVAVPAPWSGERRSLRLRSDQPLEPVRPRHRSPEDPEGRTALLPPRPEPSSRRSEPFKQSETSN